MTRAKRTALFVAFLCMALVVGLESSARTERLRWNHPYPDTVDGYRVYYGTESSVASWQHIDVGTPPTESDPVHGEVCVYDLEGVEDTATIHVAVTAYNGDQESNLSNIRTRSPIDDSGSEPDDGGTPPPDDGGTTPPANAAIDHFVLWNGETGSVIDSDFTSGEHISVTDHGCTAIEVIGNNYLMLSNSPGSIQFDFDGQTPRTCSDAGLTHENEPPFAWEEELGPDQFRCAASLAGVGSHVLTVTPYDGEDCSGNAGPSVTLSFDVIDADSSGAIPPAGETLGTPGRPTLVMD